MVVSVSCTSTESPFLVSYATSVVCLMPMSHVSRSKSRQAANNIVQLRIVHACLGFWECIDVSSVLGRVFAP